MTLRLTPSLSAVAISQYVYDSEDLHLPLEERSISYAHAFQPQILTAPSSEIDATRPEASGAVAKPETRKSWPVLVLTDECLRVGLAHG